MAMEVLSPLLFTSPIDWMRCLTLTQKKKRSSPKLPKIEGFILKSRILYLALSYIAERRTTFAKAYEIKVRCYRDHVEEYIENWGNIFRTGWEIIGNFKGT